MCRNIKTLHNFEPPASQDEIRAAAIQFVRKVFGSARPSKANEASFDIAVSRITVAVEDLLGSMVTNAAPRNREIEVDRVKRRSANRFS